ncbi:EAL domain-containing protein [Pseudoduganella sp. FT93W]|uniref:EAL domain-containing protein n=1 Tax=Duganella fentianensis TaxID=2692177 RepID=A0A845HYL0_9BURK|nr:EAL domain-containing protein [Duganella fentianensis]MYN44847.1 EAL domain-containing protein [Duganella fentianensis]
MKPLSSQPEPAGPAVARRKLPAWLPLALTPLLLAVLAAVALQRQHGVLAASLLATLLVLLLAVVLRQLVLLPRRRLATQQRREQVTFDAAPDGIVRVDQNGIIRMVNPAMLKLSGYQRDQLLGQNVSMLLPQALRARHTVSMAGYFAQPRTRAMGEAALELLCSDGSLRPVEISLGHWQEGTQRHAIAYIHDLSERHAFERSLQHRATHDDLTSLPNRRLFKALLQQAALRSGRQATRLSLLFLDLDHFKTINDNFGHAVGDTVLIEAGNRIQSVLRSGDVLARLGGDEFAVLLGELGSPDDAMRVAGKLLEVLKVPYTLRHQQIYSGASIGIAFLPDDAGNVDTLLRYADMAMYQAKQNGRGHFACYSHELNARAHEDMLIHSRLKEALAQNRLQLHYQPQVDVQSGLLIGAEALLRWHDEQLGQVSPERFVAVAEATGLILPLSDWVLEQVCQQICRWQQAGTPLRVAVNFSAHQFNQPHLAQQVAAVLQRSGAPAALLDIEITETVVMARPDQARNQIAALVALGCSVALDDFGTGYSSLTRLKDLPVSKLKIDRSFVQGLPGDSNDCTIAQAIIGLARSFNLKMVAEGVENAAQLAYLREQGCELYQGWWYARAMPAEALSELLQAPQTVQA